MVRPSLGLLLCGCLVACSRQDADERNGLAPEAAKPGLPGEGESALLFGFETRDRQLWLHHGAEDPRYTVKAMDGSVLAADIDAATLARDFPELQELVDAESPLIDGSDR